MDESQFFTNHSFPIAFTLPSRLKPPFPSAQHEAMLAHRANAMAAEASKHSHSHSERFRLSKHSSGSSRRSLSNKVDTPKSEKRIPDVPIRSSDAFDLKNGICAFENFFLKTKLIFTGKSGRRRSKSPKPSRAYPPSERDKNKKSEKSPYSIAERHRRDTVDRRSNRNTDYDARDKKSRHLGSAEREGGRRSRRNSPEERHRKRKKNESPESRHTSDKDRQTKDIKKGHEARSSSSLSSKRRKTDTSPKDINNSKSGSKNGGKPS